ncbi:hypothetical protein NDU88_003842 [Pleurodeles waltl]|uniref:Uncharacterized protein n=1 Tax=Pleurodeles waltl TaxID=8319 RepID=A0AAV7QA56_PLEWA|nr:hypothetical protein NDU88_003842 [Pleurodeles waltl]
MQHAPIEILLIGCRNSTASASQKPLPVNQLSNQLYLVKKLRRCDRRDFHGSRFSEHGSPDAEKKKP